MGYRNYIWVINKDKANSIRGLDLDALNKKFGKDFDVFDLRNKLKAKEAIELGKYAPVDVISKYLTPFFLDIETNAKQTIDTEINIADPIILKLLYMYYKKEMIDYYTKLSTDTNFGRLQHEFKELATWTNMIDLDTENKYSLTTSWRYDHALFNFMYLLKIFNPKKQYLMWVGY